MGWINTWLERRRLRARALFRYHDGAGFRYADPAEVWRKLLNHPQMNFVEMVPLAQAGKEPATGIVLGALGEIFGVEAWAEETRSGLTTWEMLDLIRQFDEYLLALKKNISPSRMPWQLSGYESSTGTGSADPPADPPGEPMNSSSDSSSTPSASSAEEATPSSEPSPTPSSA